MSIEESRYGEFNMKAHQVVALGLLLGMALYAMDAQARCEIANDSGVITLEPQSVVVDPDLPVGSVIRNINLANGGVSRLTCTEAHTVPVKSSLQLADADIDDGIRELYLEDGTPTGVGVRLRFRENNEASAFPLPNTRNLTFSAGQNYVWRVGIEGDLVLLRRDVSYGNVRSNERIARTVVQDQNNEFPNFKRLRLVRTGAFRVIAPTCSIDAGSLNQTVDLGQHTVDSFADQNATAWKDFNLAVTSCNNPIETIAGITFGQGSDADAINPSLFSMNQGGPGGLGIAIQAADGDNAPMLPGETRDFAAVAAGNSYRFQARLERTGGEVTAGAVNRPVTVRVTFR
jgi:major type 1 subunit fimbrin (pilin)